MKNIFKHLLLILCLAAACTKEPVAETTPPEKAPAPERLTILFYYSEEQMEYAEANTERCMNVLFETAPYEAFRDIIQYEIYDETEGNDHNGDTSPVIRVYKRQMAASTASVALPWSKEIYLTQNIVFVHEVGHIFNLVDEYNMDEEFVEREHAGGVNVSADVKNETFNFSMTNDPDNCPWTRFFNEPQYEGKIGFYPRRNGYVPSETSIMDTSRGVIEHRIWHNAPSRWGIFRTLQAIREGVAEENITPEFEEHLWQEFLEYDKVNLEIPY